MYNSNPSPNAFNIYIEHHLTFEQQAVHCLVMSSRCVAKRNGDLAETLLNKTSTLNIHSHCARSQREIF